MPTNFNLLVKIGPSGENMQRDLLRVVLDHLDATWGNRRAIIEFQADFVAWFSYRTQESFAEFLRKWGVEIVVWYADPSQRSVEQQGHTALLRRSGIVGYHTAVYFLGVAEVTRLITAGELLPVGHNNFYEWRKGE